MTLALPDDCLSIISSGFDKETIGFGFKLFDGHGCDGCDYESLYFYFTEIWMFENDESMLVREAFTGFEGH